MIRTGRTELVVPNSVRELTLEALILLAILAAVRGARAAWSIIDMLGLISLSLIHPL